MFSSLLTRRLRPTTTTEGLPGNATTAAHAGSPKPGQASHHKLSTLDAPIARNGLLAPEHALAPRVAALTGSAEGPQADTRPPRHKLTRLAGTVARGVARAAGLVHGQPKPHDTLIRYQGTQVGAAGEPRGTGLGAIVPELGAALAAERAQLQRQAALDEIDALTWLLDSHLDRLTGELDLRARRAAGVADRAHDLRTEHPLLDAQLETHQAAIDATADALARTEALRDRLRPQVQADQAALADMAGSLPDAATDALGTLLRDERADEAAGRQAALADLDQACTELRALLQSHQASAAELAGRSDHVTSALAQALRSADVNAGEIWQFENDAQALRDLKDSLAPVREARAQALEQATTAATQARESFNQLEAGRLGEVLASPPGFEPITETHPLRQATAAWPEQFETGLARFGADAIRPADTAAIAMQALSMATRGDATRAAEVIAELQDARIADLAPPVDDGNAASPALSTEARETAWLLASVPRGMQVLAQLLPHDALAWTAPQRDAMRLGLRAGLAIEGAPQESGLRAWLAQGQRAARRALHATDPAQALAAAPVAERAAYHAMRNGYFSNEPGSPYDKANQQLQKLADWLHARHQQAVGATRTAGLNPLSSLGEALTLGEATALPTPRRRAGQRLREAAGQIVEWLMARRQLLEPGQPPSAEDVALQALAEHVQWLPDETDLATHTLDDKAWKAIDERRQHLHQHLRTDPSRQGPDGAADSPADPALAAAWAALRGPEAERGITALFDKLRSHLASITPDTAGPPAEGSHADAARRAHWATTAAGQHQRIQATIAEAQRLLRDGDPARATTGAALFDLSRDMLEMLEWRDKLRIVGQRAFGLNAGALSSALPGGVLGAKLVAGAQHNEDRLIEFYMGRTGLYVQIGEQATNQFQLGGGANAGYTWELDDDHQVKAGLGGAADWRMKWERGMENGVQLRVPRLGKGRELELRAEFMDMFEHLLHIASPGPDGAPARRDWVAELMAHHPSVNMGLIDNATRRSSGTELNLSGFGGFRFIKDGERPRRIALAASAGLKFRQDRSETATTVAGYMTTIYRDSTAQAKTEAGGRLTAGAQLGRWGDANLSAGLVDYGRNVELRANGSTRFCTLFMFGDEIDPVRSDRATDYLRFDEFEREVRSEWPEWVRYGYGKLSADIEPAARYAVAERQLEDFIGQAREFAAKNGFATMYADKALQAEAAPLLDAARARARLALLAGDAQAAAAEEQAFDDLLTQPGVWEPTILMLREKTKLQVERGLDFIVKHQRNRIAESQRTVGQWILYEPVPQPQPGTPAVPPARRWAASE